MIQTIQYKITYTKMIWKPNKLGSLNLKWNKLEQNRTKWNNWGDNEKALMDINEIWVFEVSKMNNRRFNTKRSVVRLMKAHITLTWPHGPRSWVITLPTSQISFSCPYSSVFQAMWASIHNQSCWTDKTL